MMPSPEYLAAVTEIFSSIRRVKPLIEGQPDREIRRPALLMDLAERLGLMPDPSVTIRVSGSKGKGSVSRALAAILQSHLPGQRIGLLVSPQEIEHYDRIRIDGRPVSEASFIRIHRSLRPLLQELEPSLREREYISPSGTFVLMALALFKECGVGHYVLETGRGVLHDEVGRIASDHAVVTNIFEEHLRELGPTVRDIAADKLSIAATSRRLFGGPGIRDWLHVVPPRHGCTITVIDAPPGPDPGDAPFWLRLDHRLAEQAAASYLEMHGIRVPAGAPAMVSPSFHRVGRADDGREYLFEALVSRKSFDDRLIARLIDAHGDRLAVVASIPDGKDVDGITTYLRERNVMTFHCPLRDAPHLSYRQVLAAFPDRIIGEVDPFDGEGLEPVCDRLIALCDPTALYFLGTHSFIRLVKLMLMQRGLFTPYCPYAA